MRWSHFHAMVFGAHLVMLCGCIYNGYAFAGFLNVGFGLFQGLQMVNAAYKEMP